MRVDWGGDVCRVPENRPVLRKLLIYSVFVIAVPIATYFIFSMLVIPSTIAPSVHLYPRACLV